MWRLHLLWRRVVYCLVGLCWYVCGLWFLFFFFKQKTAYEMRISDWSSDVCSSDLLAAIHARHGYAILLDGHSIAAEVPRFFEGRLPDQIGRASCRERVCQYV